VNTDIFAGPLERADEYDHLKAIGEEAAGLQTKLGQFITSAWDVLEPETVFLPNWHIDAISERLEAVTAGEVNRLIINIPPRYMKSLSVSVFWPCWSWTRKPTSRWVFSSYADKLSIKHSIDRRTIIESDWYRIRWGDQIQLSSDQNVKSEFQNTQRGLMLATSVGGSVTGKGGDIIVFDDPLNPEEAHSDAKRETANRYFDQTLSTRLNDKRLGAIVVVMQRVHEEDLTGHLLAKGGWETLVLPAEYEPGHPFVWPSDPRSDQGDLLWPEREGPPEIEVAKIDLGSYGYAGQYQQRPAPAEGGLIKRSWWRYYDKTHRLNFTGILQSWDTALKDKTVNDFTVGQLWGMLGSGRYLIREVRGHWDLTETITQAHALHEWAEERWGNLPHRVIVEKAASGPEVIAALRHAVGGVIGVAAKGDKVQRASAVSPIIESGNVFLPGRLAQDGSGPDAALTPGWVQEFIEEHSAFPNGAHDDRVDAMSQALLAMRRSPVGPVEPDAQKVKTLSAGLLRREL
jgi:predicted phage terminase large subunit-like protein